MLVQLVAILKIHIKLLVGIDFFMESYSSAKCIVFVRRDILDKACVAKDLDMNYI